MERAQENIPGIKTCIALVYVAGIFQCSSKRSNAAEVSVNKKMSLCCKHKPKQETAKYAQHIAEPAH